MNKLSIILLAVIVMASVNLTAQGPIPYEQRIERGFGQREEPRWAGDRPGWMRREESNRQIQRQELTIINRDVQSPRRSFSRRYNVCSQCQKHMNNSRPQNQHRRGFNTNRKYRNHGRG